MTASTATMVPHTANKISLSSTEKDSVHVVRCTELFIIYSFRF